MKILVEGTALMGERSGVGSYLINLLCNLPPSEDDYYILLGRGLAPWGKALARQRFQAFCRSCRGEILVPFFPYRPRWLTEKIYQRWYLPRWLGRTGATLYMGLPVVCGTTAHGTAFDKAGQGIADSGSLEAALEYTVLLGC